MSWFWSERFWLPDNVTWADFKPRVVNGQMVHFPQPEHLVYTVQAGVALVVLRILVESFVQLPVGVAGGWIRLRDGQSTLGACVEHATSGFMSEWIL